MKQLALRPCYDVIKIQPMGRLESNQCFNHSDVTWLEKPIRIVSYIGQIVTSDIDFWHFPTKNLNGISKMPFLFILAYQGAGGWNLISRHTIWSSLEKYLWFVVDDCFACCVFCCLQWKYFKYFSRFGSLQRSFWSLQRHKLHS